VPAIFLGSGGVSLGFRRADFGRGVSEVVSPPASASASAPASWRRRLSSEIVVAAPWNGGGGWVAIKTEEISPTAHLTD
jgi:hypothetical protein